jgi:hypothetical protein
MCSGKRLAESQTTLEKGIALISATEMPVTAGSVTGRVVTTRTLLPLSASVGDAASAHRKI